MRETRGDGAPLPEDRRSGGGAPLLVVLPGSTEAAPPPAALRRVADALGRAPWIVVLDGAVSPVQLELALGADLLVAASRTRFLPPRGRCPLLPGTGWRLSHRLGAGGAVSLWTARRPWPAARALRRGLVDLLADDPLGRATEIREILADRPEVAAFLAALERRGVALSERAGLALERAFFALAFAREAARAGARAFLDRRRENR